MAILVFRADHNGMLRSDTQYSSLDASGFTAAIKDNLVELIDACTSATDDALTISAYDPRGLRSVDAQIDAAIDALEITNTPNTFATADQAFNVFGGVSFTLDTSVITDKNKFALALDALRRAVMGATLLPAAS